MALKHKSPLSLLDSGCETNPYSGARCRFAHNLATMMVDARGSLRNEAFEEIYVTSCHMSGPRRKTIRLRGTFRESRALVVLAEAQPIKASVFVFPFTALLFFVAFLVFGCLRRVQKRITACRRLMRAKDGDLNGDMVKIQICDTKQTVVAGLSTSQSSKLMLHGLSVP